MLQIFSYLFGGMVLCPKAVNLPDIIDVPMVAPLLNPQMRAKLFSSIKAVGWGGGVGRNKTKIGFSSFIGE